MKLHFARQAVYPYDGFWKVSYISTAAFQQIKHELDDPDGLNWRVVEIKDGKVVY